MNAKRKKLLTFFIISLFFLSFFFLILNVVSKIKKTSKELSEIKSDFKSLKKRAENIENFRKKIHQLKDDLSLVENSFVDKDFPIDFIKFIEAMSVKEEVSLEISSSFLKDNFLFFQLKIKGWSQKVFRFLEKIENCAYFIEIEKINISKISSSSLKDIQKEEAKSQLSVDVLIKVYPK